MSPFGPLVPEMLQAVEKSFAPYIVAFVPEGWVFVVWGRLFVPLECGGSAAAWEPSQLRSEMPKTKITFW